MSAAFPTEAVLFFLPGAHDGVVSVFTQQTIAISISFF